MSVQSLSAIIAAIANIYLAFIVILQKNKTAVHRSFFTLSISLAIWNLGYFKSYPDFKDIFWWQILYIGTSFIPCTGIYFALSFTQDRYRINRQLLYTSVIISSGFVISLYTDLFRSVYWRWALSLYLFPLTYYAT